MEMNDRNGDLRDAFALVSVTKYLFQKAPLGDSVSGPRASLGGCRRADGWQQAFLPYLSPFTAETLSPQSRLFLALSHPEQTPNVISALWPFSPHSFLRKACTCTSSLPCHLSWRLPILSTQCPIGEHWRTLCLLPPLEGSYFHHLHVAGGETEAQ